MNSLIFTLVIVIIGSIDYTVGGPITFVISGAEMNEVCNLAQNLTVNGLSRDDISKTLDRQLHKILGLTGSLKKFPIVRYTGRIKSHPMLRYKRGDETYIGSGTHSGEGNTDAEDASAGAVTQTGTFNFNVSDLIYIVIDALSLKAKKRCLPSQSLCSSIVLPETIDLLDQEQILSIIDQFVQLQNSLINCDSS
ncbi:uncharacterized protein LOC128392765 [Panonychus citri]|uniref:uncharacterized protein LOC128392765 n=1 Tax=Panonychus citri TaxID=50023 RepID=UPI0023076C4B|nr:uncharacterized protein LOC128392765 [Panonychus citri]